MLARPVFYSTPVGEWSIAISLSVCLSVCLSHHFMAGWHNRRINQALV